VTHSGPEVLLKTCGAMKFVDDDDDDDNVSASKNGLIQVVEGQTW